MGEVPRVAYAVCSMPYTRTNGPLTPSQCAKIEHQFWEIVDTASNLSHHSPFFSVGDLRTGLDMLSSHSVS